MNRIQLERSVCGHVRALRPLSSVLMGLAIAFAVIATIAAGRAQERADTTRTQVEQLRAELAEVVRQANAGHKSLRIDIELNTEDVGVCHHKAALLGRAIEAVAKTCPGRFRAPVFVQEAEQLRRPER